MIHLHIIPETPEHGPPWACAEIRLLRPYGHVSLSRRLSLTTGPRLPSGRVDAVVTQRGGPVGATLPEIVELVAALKSRGIRLVYDLDDDLLATHPSPPVERFLESMRPKVRYLLREADLITVSTPMLSMRLGVGRSDVQVWPNALDEALVPALRHTRPGADIGYFGTNSHLQDLMAVASDLSASASRQSKRPTAEFCGVTDDPRIGAILGHSMTVSVRPTQGDYSKFHLMLANEAQWRVGLAPLSPGPFNDAKSDIKALDYAAAGIPVIASNVTPYADAANHETIILASPGGFGEAAFRLLNDEGERTRLATAAHCHLMERRVLAVRVESLFSMLEQALNQARRY